MKILICGLGGIGRRHAKLLLEHFSKHELFAFRTGLGKMGQSGDVPGVSVLVTWNSVKRVKPDIAFICNPTSLHIAYATKCAELGMHLWIEKPIGDNTEGLADLLELVIEKKLTAYVAYPLHFHDSIRRLRGVVKDEQVWHAEMVSASSLATWRPGDPRDYYSAYEAMGGGALLDVSHEIYLAQYLFGSIQWLQGTRGLMSHVTVDTDDFADIITQHVSGITCNIHLNLFSNSSERWVSLRLASGRRVKILTNPWLEEMNKAFERQMFHFMNNLDNPMLDGNLLSCVPLFRQIVDLRERTKP